LLTVEIEDAPLPQVLKEIGKLAGFKVVQVADFDDFPRVTSKFEDLPLQIAVERLVANTSRIFFYALDGSAQPKRVISQLWLLGPGEANADTTQADDIASRLQYEEPLIRRQAIQQLVQRQGKAAVLDNLTVLLQTDPDPLVRSRVAMALGSLGDERAVTELETALQDSDFTVRAQSISALGLIGGDRAILVLGSILMNTSIDVAERVLAAQSLWKQNSEMAQGFLQASQNDPDERVRAASLAATSIPAGPADGKAGVEVEQ
jgi:hypothetical protein